MIFSTMMKKDSLDIKKQETKDSEFSKNPGFDHKTDKIKNEVNTHVENLTSQKQHRKDNNFKKKQLDSKSIEEKNENGLKLETQNSSDSLDDNKKIDHNNKNNFIILVIVMVSLMILNVLMFVLIIRLIKNQNK